MWSRLRNRAHFKEEFILFPVFCDVISRGRLNSQTEVKVYISSVHVQITKNIFLIFFSSIFSNLSLKVAFFRKCDSYFRSPDLKKKIFQKTILNLKLKISAHNIILFWSGILNFKFKIVFWNIFFSRFEDLKKRIALSEKKPPLNKDRN